MHTEGFIQDKQEYKNKNKKPQEEENKLTFPININHIADFNTTVHFWHVVV